MKNVLIFSNDHTNTAKLKRLAENFQEVIITESTTFSRVKELLESTNISLILMDIELLEEENPDRSNTNPLVSQIINSEIQKNINKVSDSNQVIDKVLNDNNLHENTKKKKYFILKNGNKKEIIHFDKILWLEAEGNYTFINTEETKYVLKKPLKKMIEYLDNRFGQCHKKYCININYVYSIRRTQVILKNKKEIPMTYFFKKTFMMKMQSVL